VAVIGGEPDVDVLSWTVAVSSRISAGWLASQVSHWLASPRFR
jgi:hypothetical protein